MWNEAANQMQQVECIVVCQNSTGVGNHVTLPLKNVLRIRVVVVVVHPLLASVLDFAAVWGFYDLVHQRLAVLEHGVPREMGFVVLSNHNDEC